ncbi:MAG: hypothetical protein ABIZ69_06135 [Ilumatobacteraceae bacterium]
MTDHQPVSDGQFTVRGAFTIGERTCIGGYISAGTVYVGDDLVWSNGATRHRVRCAGVEYVKEMPALDPPTMALIVRDVEPEELDGVELVLSFRATPEPATPR